MDVSEFKSSFKMVVSQGLRNVAQVSSPRDSQCQCYNFFIIGCGVYCYFNFNFAPNDNRDVNCGAFCDTHCHVIGLIFAVKKNFPVSAKEL